jgi:AraC-like DNA-binding protein
LAQYSGLSRAALRAASAKPWEPPLSYVTRWRMTVAAELLEQGERIAKVAQKVGYDSEFAFAKAFKRIRGIPPRAVSPPDVNLTPLRRIPDRAYSVDLGVSAPWRG